MTMKLSTAVSATLVSAAIVPASAAGAPGSQTERRMEKAAAGQQLSYWLYVPDGAEKAEAASVPLILFLHGSGERGADLKKVLVHGPPKLAGNGSPLDSALVVSPQCPDGERWKPASLKALLDEVLAGYPAADPSRLYITGLSMGGYGTWGMLADFPDLFAAAVPICGGGDITRLKGRPELKRQPTTFSLENLLRAKDVPIWAFHGSDDAAVPAEESELLVDALKKAGGKSVRLTIYQGVGHDSWTQTYADPEVYAWLFAQRKG